MINQFQTLSSEQLSSSIAEMTPITDCSKEDIVTCNSDSASSSTWESTAQGMYSPFNYFVKYCPSSPLTMLFMCVLHVNFKVQTITLVCMFAGNQVDELNCHS